MFKLKDFGIQDYGKIIQIVYSLIACLYNLKEHDMSNFWCSIYYLKNFWYHYIFIDNSTEETVDLRFFVLGENKSIQPYILIETHVDIHDRIFLKEIIVINFKTAFIVLF